jgi:cell division protein FtsI/penicillin-binding protein 2
MVRVSSLLVAGESGETSAYPGSILKPLIAEALPENERMQCPRLLSAGERRVDCTHPPLGVVTMEDALVYSCNCWFAAMAMRCEPGKLQQTLQRYGLNAMRPDSEAQQGLLALGLWGLQPQPREIARAYARLCQNPPTVVRRALARVVEEGTGQAAQPPGLLIAGKTGTAPPGAWFAGWAPREKPEVAFAVYVSSGRGMTDAAPAAREVLERWFVARR